MNPHRPLRRHPATLLLVTCLLAVASPAATTESTGPWGTLRASPLFLTPSDASLAAYSPAPIGRWTFTDQSWPEIDAFLAGLSLTADQCAGLRDPRHRAVDPDTGQKVIEAPDALRLQLSPDARVALYRHLGRSQLNPEHNLPFQLAPPARIELARLNPELRARLDQLTFTYGNRRRIVDTDLLLALARDEPERQRLRRLLFTYPSFQLELTRATFRNRPEAAAWWTAPGARPTDDWLARFERTPALETLDLARLLPPLPRGLINSFPDGANSPFDANCFWIALNFFRTQTEDRLLPYTGETDESEAIARAELDTHYRRVDPPYRYGDVIALVYEQDHGATGLGHAMLYLADNYVVTKNGSGHRSPVQFARLEDLVDFYTWAFPCRVQAYRPRTSP